MKKAMLHMMYHQHTTSYSPRRGESFWEKNVLLHVWSCREQFQVSEKKNKAMKTGLQNNLLINLFFYFFLSTLKQGE
jgi:hypothetical protein